MTRLGSLIPNQVGKFRLPQPGKITLPLTDDVQSSRICQLLKQYSQL